MNNMLCVKVIVQHTTLALLLKVTEWCWCVLWSDTVRTHSPFRKNSSSSCGALSSACSILMVMLKERSNLCLSNRPKNHLGEFIFRENLKHKAKGKNTIGPLFNASKLDCFTEGLFQSRLVLILRFYASFKWNRQMFYGNVSTMTVGGYQEKTHWNCIRVFV